MKHKKKTKDQVLQAEYKKIQKRKKPFKSLDEEAAAYFKLFNILVGKK